MKENLESEKEESTLVQKSMESLAVVDTEIIAHAALRYKKKGKGGRPKKKKAHSCNRCNKEFKFPTFLAEVYAF